MRLDSPFRAEISSQALDPLHQQKFIELSQRMGSGASVSFVGYVRGEQDGHSIEGLELEYYPGMLEAQLEKLIASARTRFHELQAAWLWHRVGWAAVGEQLVLVQTAAAHRKVCFESAQYLMDYLKTSAPIWKSYQRQQQQCWVAAKASDRQSWRSWS